MVIANFPDFSPLALDDKDAYEELIADYPPLSDLTFASLHIWWNLEGKFGLSKLNDNLVLNYSLPFDPENSGYSLVGNKDTDQSISTILAYLKENHLPQKLVHVPEFVIDSIQDRQKLVIEEETDYHEYVFESQKLAGLEGHEHSRTRRKVGRFLREADDSEIELKEQDLNDPQIKKTVFDSISQWQPQRLTKFDPHAGELKSINQTLSHSHHFATHNLALMIDGELKGIALYHLTHDKKHYILTHLKVDYGIPHIFDYMTQAVAKKAVNDGVEFLNLEMDLGIEGLRRHKMGLRPANFWKKYRISASR